MNTHSGLSYKPPHVSHLKVNVMNSGSDWQLISCPVCRSVDLSFKEARSLSVYYRQRSGGIPSGEATRVICEDFAGSLYEYRSQTVYPEELRAQCHSCGLKWVIAGCTRLEEMSDLPQSSPKPKKAKRKIKARDVVKDVVEGISDPELMDKYDFSPRQLEVLFQQLVAKGLLSQGQIDARLNMAETQITRAFDDTRRSIEELDDEFTPGPSLDEPTVRTRTKAAGKGSRSHKTKLKLNDFIADVLTGMTDPELMAKHSLKRKQLEYVFQRSLDLGYLTETELYERTNVVGSEVTKEFVDIYQSLKHLET